MANCGVRTQFCSTAFQSRLILQARGDAVAAQAAEKAVHAGWASTIDEHTCSSSDWRGDQSAARAVEKRLSK